jgi:hypothetical protein
MRLLGQSREASDTKLNVITTNPGNTMLLEFELDGIRFRAEKLSAIQQLHLSRKVAPLLPPIAPLVVQAQKKLEEKEKANKEKNEEEEFTLDDIMSLVELAQPFADAFADMEDKDIEKIFLLTLTSVKVQTDEARDVWMPLWIPGSNRPAGFEQLNDLSKLLPIVVRVIIHNLGNFINGLLTRRKGGYPVSNGVPSPVEKIG